MSRWIIEVEVDEEALIASDEMAGEEECEQSIEAHISREMGWVEQSGIYVENIT